MPCAEVQPSEFGSTDALRSGPDMERIPRVGDKGVSGAVCAHHGDEGFDDGRGRKSKSVHGYKGRMRGMCRRPVWLSGRVLGLSEGSEYRAKRHCQ